MTEQEPRPTPVLWRLEYLRKWHGQPELIQCVKWFQSQLAAELHRNEIANGKGEFISLAKYVAVDPSYVLPDPPRTLTPEQVERAKILVKEADRLQGLASVRIGRLSVDLLREVVGDE